MATFESNHTVIIPQCDQIGQQQNLRIPAEIMPKTAHLTEMNAELLTDCTLCKWRHADFHYEHPRLETVHLCKMCQRLLTPLGFLALIRRDMPGDETKHAEVWIARHTQEAIAS